MQGTGGYHEADTTCLILRDMYATYYTARVLSSNSPAIFPHLGFSRAPAAHPKFAISPYFVLVNFSIFFDYVPDFRDHKSLWFGALT